MTLLATMIVVSLVGLFVAPWVVETNLLRPYWVARQNRYWTLVTCAFIHADIAHLFFNAFTFYAFAFQLERAIGTGSFVQLYVFAMLVSSIGTWLQHRNEPGYASLGASGAILGVLFAYILYFPAAKLFILPIPVPIPAWLFALAYVAYSLYASRYSKGRTNHDAHLAGAAAGIVFVLLTDTATVARAMRSFLG